MSDFTRDAQREAAEADRSPISLVNGKRLIDLLIDNEVGVTPQRVTLLELDEAAFVSQVIEGPEFVDKPPPAPEPLRRTRTNKVLSLWPLPGGGDVWKATLDKMLQYVSDVAPSVSEAVAWLIKTYDRVNSEKTARGYWQVLRSFGVIETGVSGWWSP